ncbi:hypothetical protein QOT17_003685 [Balamuthia mandrillaris]
MCMSLGLFLGLLLALGSAVPVPPNNGAYNKIAIEEELLGTNCFDCDDDSSDSDAGLPDNYQQKPASEKRGILWKLLTQDRTPRNWTGGLDSLKMILGWNMSLAFTVDSDVRPYGPRVVHIVGAVAKFDYVPSPLAKQNYTGLFKSGAEGIIRLSTVNEPSPGGWFSGAGINPAYALKFFIDKQPSFNFAAMYKMTGHDGMNLFEHPLCNHVPRFDYNFLMGLLAKAFQKVSIYEGLVGLSGMAAMQSNGKRVNNPKFPLNIIVQPNPALKRILDGNEDSAVMKISEHVGKDSPLIGKPAFRLYGLSGPNWPHNDTIDYLGDLILRSEFTTSLWGDKHLAFEQQKFDDDLALRPEWKPYINDDFLMYEGVPDKYEDHIPTWN